MNEIIIAQIELKISQIQRELVVAERYRKATLEGQFMAYEDILKLVKCCSK